MLSTSLFVVAAAFGFATAAPIDTRTSSAEVIFHGAAGAQYSLTVPLDGSVTYTSTSYYSPLLFPNIY